MSDAEFPWRKPPAPGAAAKNCGNCANFPCPAYIAQGQEAQVMFFGVGAYHFSPNQVPMACGGVDWKEKVVVERQRREPEGAAFDQFVKRKK